MHTTTPRTGPRHSGPTRTRLHAHVWTGTAALAAVALTILETAGNRYY